MRAPRPLPEELAGRAFTLSAARAAGVGVDRLRARDLDRSIRGVRMPLAAPLPERCRAALLACRGDAFVCGATAAELHGMPLPGRLRSARRGLVDLATPGPGRAVRRGGIAARSLRISPGDITKMDGLRLTALPRTWCDLASACSVPELVAAADWAIRHGRVTEAVLRAAVDRHPDHRQRAKLSAASDHLDPASESPKESELRALVVLAGLPRPEVNPVVVDERGRFVARVDLLFRPYREVLEYQGDHHRTDLGQWRRDRTREAELESLDLHVMEVTEADLRSPRRLIDRIVRNLRRRGWSGEPAFSRWFPAD